MRTPLHAKSYFTPFITYLANILMRFHQSLSLAVTAGLLSALTTASAHISITGRTFDGDLIAPGFQPIDGASVSINTQTISSGFGWADATDANWGDSHRTRVFKFTLASTQTVAITIARNLNGTGSNETFLPAFSLFTTPTYQAETHDSGTLTVNYLTGQFGTTAIG